MDVMSKEQAILAEEAGAAAIMVLDKIPSLIRKEGGVARMVRICLFASGRHRPEI
jgi:pyridoxal 5'-phosphate synthase pdxS subunit